jgi:hypothetical protein
MFPLPACPVPPANDAVVTKTPETSKSEAMIFPIEGDATIFMIFLLLPLLLLLLLLLNVRSGAPVALRGA